jgi:hypothetical protein
MIHSANAETLSNPGASAQVQKTSRLFGSYVARSLAADSPTVGPIFDELVTMTEPWRARADDARADTPTVDRRVRAALRQRPQ